MCARADRVCGGGMSCPLCPGALLAPESAELAGCLDPNSREASESKLSLRLPAWCARVDPSLAVQREGNCWERDSPVVP